MKVGYIVNGSHPLLQTIKDFEIVDVIGIKPILIIGVSKTLEIYPETNLLSKIIDQKKRIYYSFSKEESEIKYEENLKRFIEYCLEDITSQYEFITCLYPNDIAQTDVLFYYETKTTINVVSSNYKVYYFNKEVYSYFFEDFSWKPKKSTRIISWHGYNFFQAYLKANNCYIEEKQLNNLLLPYVDTSKYFSAICFEWFKQLDIVDAQVWQRAYFIEKRLSQCKIKIDSELIIKHLEVNENLIYKAILNHSENDYVIQNYNGTDKITGRLFPKMDHFSIQTIPTSLRNIIIAEPNCLLVEFDYSYFEYTLLSQIIGLDIEDDPHQQLALLLFKDKDKRAEAKIINYGILYGKSLLTIIHELISDFKVPYTKDQLLEMLKPLTNIIDPFQQKLLKEFDQKGYIINYFGRRIVPQKRFACLNNYIQSTAAELVIIKLEKLFKYLENYDNINRIVLQNHDSILFNLSEKVIEDTEIASEIKNILEEPENNLIAKVNLKYGINWSFV